MKRFSPLHCIILLCGLSLVGCDTGNGSDKDIVKKSVNFNDIDTEVKDKIKDVVYTMPSPMEASMLIKDVDAIYMHDIMNPVDKYPNYLSSNFNSAINVGIYGADLGYACVYVNVQDAFAYLRTTRKLAEYLGVLGAFELKMISRFQENLENRDSMMAIVGESFQLTDQYLKENERDNIAALIVAGSWIEGLYISTQVIEQYPANVPEEQRNKILEPIVKSVAEQKLSLGNLLKLLEMYKDNEPTKALADKLYDLHVAYYKVELEEAENINASNEEGTLVIENETKVVITPESLKEITSLITEIRNSLTENLS